MWHAIGQSDRKRCQLVNMQWFPWAKKMHIKRWWKGKNGFFFGSFVSFSVIFYFIFFFYCRCCYFFFVASLCVIWCVTFYGRISEKFYFIGRFYQQNWEIFSVLFLFQWRYGNLARHRNVFLRASRIVLFMFWLKVTM